MANPSAGPSLREVILRDPLSDVTRKERSYLLGISVAGVVMLRTGLVPSKITALGITFRESDRKILLFLIGLVAAYFLAAFTLYAIADLLREFAARRTAMEAMQESANKTTLSPLSRYPPYYLVTRYRQDPGDGDAEYEYEFRDVRATLIASIRLAFEYALPLFVGLYAVTSLFIRALPL